MAMSKMHSSKNTNHAVGQFHVFIEAVTMILLRQLLQVVIIMITIYRIFGNGAR